MLGSSSPRTPFGALGRMAPKLVIIAGALRPHHRRRSLLPSGASLAFFVERSSKAPDDQAPNCRRIAKADFRLRGMDVDVDVLQRDVEEQRRDG